jgi:glycosyltransferase involved in cell wall biosynthesis
VIIEAPIVEFLDASSPLQRTGWKVVYDLIDDWSDESLGGDWYDPDVERRIVSMADGISCTADDLLRHVETLGRESSLVPNGVNEVVFGRGNPSERPSDMPEGPAIVYHGSLYGSWFDWVALESVARAFMDYALVVIGDARGVPDGLPANVRFLGLKAQSELPSYLTRSDVGLVPFVVDDVTHAVSPLKVYEYLACGLPVAAPPLRPLLGLEGVYTDEVLVEAVHKAIAADRPDRESALASHSWGSRLEAMVATVGAELRGVENSGARVFTRVPVHYDKKDRWVKNG